MSRVQEEIIFLLGDPLLALEEKTQDSLTKKIRKHRNVIGYNLKSLRELGIIEKNLLVIARNRPVYQLTKLGLEVFHELNELLKSQAYDSIRGTDFVLVRNSKTSKILMSDIFDVLIQVKKQNPTFSKLSCTLINEKVMKTIKNMANVSE